MHGCAGPRRHAGCDEAVTEAVTRRCSGVHVADANRSVITHAPFCRRCGCRARSSFSTAHRAAARCAAVGCESRGWDRQAHRKLLLRAAQDGPHATRVVQDCWTKGRGSCEAAWASLVAALLTATRMRRAPRTPGRQHAPHPQDPRLRQLHLRLLPAGERIPAGWAGALVRWLLHCGHHIVVTHTCRRPLNRLTTHPGPAPAFQTNYPDARKFIDAGEMISDAVVCDALLEELLGGRRRGAAPGAATGAPGAGAAPGAAEGGEYAGVVVDGFPRTAVQVGARGRPAPRATAAERSRRGAPLRGSRALAALLSCTQKPASCNSFPAVHSMNKIALFPSPCPAPKGRFPQAAARQAGVAAPHERGRPAQRRVPTAQLQGAAAAALAGRMSTCLAHWRGASLDTHLQHAHARLHAAGS